MPLTVFQSLPVNGLLVVTSPQDLVSMIVTKAVHMAQMMSIPVLGLIENYSYFQCPDCGAKHAIFGKSHLEQEAMQLGLPLLAQLPIDPAVAAAIDAGQAENLPVNYLEGVAAQLDGLIPLSPNKNSPPQRICGGEFPCYSTFRSIHRVRNLSRRSSVRCTARSSPRACRTPRSTGRTGGGSRRRRARRPASGR